MPTLYTMLLSKHVRGMTKGPVRAVPAAYAGHLCPETRDTVKPDPGAVRACLPSCYRAAYDRAGTGFWFPNDDSNRPAHLTLRSTRGKYLNTLYAQPYQFNPSTKHA